MSYGICLSLTISLSIMPSKSIHVAANGKILFLFIINIPLYIYTISSLSIHLLMDTGCLHTLASVNNVAVGDFPGGPVAKTLSSQCSGPRFNHWLGNWIPYAVTKSLHATTKDPTCHN